MDYTIEKIRTTACVILCSIVMMGWGQGALAAEDAAASFQNANKHYIDLVKDASKKKVRDNWLKVINEYLGIAEKYPDSDLAPEACAKGARVYEHFFKYSGKKSDLKAASQTYQDLAGKYPKSQIADDALYNAGLLEEKLGNGSKAKSLYRRVLDEYAQGDMADKAGEKLGVDPSQEKAAKASPKDKEARPAAAERDGQKPLAEVSQGRPAEKPRKEEPAAKGSDALSRVKKLSHVAREDGSRVIVELDGAAAYKAFVAPEDKALKKPVRLVVDLKGAKIPRDIPARQDVDEGIVTAIRASAHPGNAVRIVLDLKAKPVFKVSKADDPPQIIIDVGGTSLPNQATAVQADSQDGPAPPYQSPTVKKVPKGTHAQMKKDIPSIASQLGLKISKIVVDPGHGGKDPGAISASGVREKDLTLEIGKLLAKRLKADGFEVYLTRTRDEFVALEERTTFANKKKADLFLSVHINSHQNGSVSGIETYFLNLTTDSSAIEVAARENTYAERSMSDLQLILNDLMLNSKINESSRFANCVHTSVVSSALNTGYEGKNLGVRQAPFYVLLGAQMPSILIELGFLTNTTDISLLKRRTYQDTLVDGIAKGINSYIMNTTYAYSGRNK